MSFQSKTDYFAIAGNGLVITSSEENKSSQVAQAHDEKGDIVAEEVYGETSAPACTYVLSGDVAVGSINLGKATTGTGTKYVITSLQIDTSAGSPPSVQASGEEVPTTSHTDCYYVVPSADVKVCHHAQILWGAFTLSGQGCYLTQASYTASGSLTKATKDGETIAYDISDGQLQASITIQGTGSTAPTVAAGSGWTITSPVSKSNPDADYPTYSCTLTKPLTHATSTNS